ncbi:MAG: hypothetical protein PHW95_01675 [Patescibacteria group bacterium]|nr:hypothetical protein [Patescibacteria group bacterium]
MNWLQTKIYQAAKVTMLTSVLALVAFGLQLAKFEPTIAATGINQQLNYQGKLMTVSGVQVANTNYNFRFRIYNASSGGTVLWTERWTATSTQITTVNGVFSAALGSINALSNGSIDWNSDSLYLQVDLDADNNGSWEESFATRKRLTSTPYAFNANQVNGFSATSTAAVANNIPVFDSNLTLNLFNGGVSTTRATTTALYFVPQTTAPDSQTGKLYFDSGSNYFKFYNGLTWASLGGGGAAWELFNTDSAFITPTSSKPIYVPGASRLEMINASTTNVDTLTVYGNSIYNGLSTFTDLRTTNLNASTTANFNNLFIYGLGDFTDLRSTNLNASGTPTFANIINYGTYTGNGGLSIFSDLRPSMLNASTTNVDTLRVYNSLTVPDSSIAWSKLTGIPTSTTDQLPEGATNKYYANSLARAALSASSPISYDSGTGAFSFLYNTTNNWTGLNTFTDLRSTNLNASGTPTFANIINYGTYTGNGGLSIFSDLRPSMLNASTTNVDTLRVYNSLTVPDSSIAWSKLTGIPTSTTDQLPEGATNKYYANSLARAALSASSPISYDSGTGAFSFLYNTTNNWTGLNTFTDLRSTNLNASGTPTFANIINYGTYTGNGGLSIFSDLRLANGLNASSTANFLNVTSFGTVSSTVALNTQGTGHFGNNVTIDGKVGIGATSPLANLEIYDGTASNILGLAVRSSGIAWTSTQLHLGLYDERALAADTGPAIGFIARYTASAYTHMAAIKMGKDNATSGEYGGYLSFMTRANGVGEAERMRITSAGNIGINNTAPDAKLHVTGDAKITGNASTTGWFNIGTTNPLATLGTLIGAGDLFVGRNATITNNLTVDGTTLVVQADTNRVGIGTASPYATLDVQDTIRATRAGYDNLQYIQMTGDGAGNYLVANSQATNDKVFYIDAKSNTNPAGANNQIQFRNGYTLSTKMTIDSSGNVGINNTAPDAKLHVTGDAKITGNASTTGWFNIGTTNPLTTLGALIGAGDLFVGRNATVTSNLTVDGTTLVVQADTNYVGIDTASPLSKLHINNGASGNILSVESNASAIDEYAGLTLASKDSGGALWYGSEIRNINTAGNPSFLNPRLGFFTQDYSTYLPANRTEKMSILGNGNVGIGTVSPGNKLQVVGAMDATYPDLVGQINISSNDSAAINKGGVLSFGGNYTGTTNTSWATIYGRKENSTAGDYAGYLGFVTRAVGNTGTEKMRITSAGAVGIGNTAPDAKLHVTGDAKITGNASTTGWFNIGTTNPLATLGTLIGAGDLFVGRNATVTNSFIVDAGTLFVDSGNNYVGIGTTAPDAGLTVNGSIDSILPSTNRHYYNVADYNYTAGAIVGTTIITLPKYGSSTMLQIKISGYDYSSGRGAWEIIIGGYNYSTHDWYNTSVEYKGTPPFTQVRLANNGTNDLILLGTTATSWAYPKVVVTDVMTGHSNLNNWGTGWSITNTATEPTLFNVTTLTPKMFIDTAGKVGIGNTAPASLLTLGTAGTTAGSLSLAGATSGVITLATAAAAGTYTLTLPTSAGSLNQVLTTNGSGTLSWSTGPSTQAWQKYTGLAYPTDIITPTTTNASIFISGNATTTGNITITQAANPAGNLAFSAANPVIKASSYITVPGGMYVSGGTLYAQNSLKARGGIADDQNTYLTLAGGTSGYSYFSGNVGIGQTAPAAWLEINGGATTNDLFKIATTSNSAIVFVDKSGNFGIGTTTFFNSPENGNPKLVVDGGLTGDGGIMLNSAQGRSAYLEFANGAKSEWYISSRNTLMAGDNHQLNFDTYVNGGPTNVLSLMQSGNIGFGTTSPIYNTVTHLSSSAANPNDRRANWTRVDLSGSISSNISNYGQYIYLSNTGGATGGLIANSYYGGKSEVINSGATTPTDASWGPALANYGYYGHAQSTGTANAGSGGSNNRSNYGVYGLADGNTNGSTSNYGVYGDASTGDLNYGVYARTWGAAGQTGYGLYAMDNASAGTSYAGYFQGSTASDYVIYINNIGTTPGIHDDSGAELTAAGAWNAAPSWSWYKNQTADQPTDYLEKLRNLPVHAWQYKNEVVDGSNRYLGDSNVHVSPFLDDFNSAFSIGPVNSVNYQDWIGVTMGAVKELDSNVLQVQDSLKSLESKIGLDQAINNPIVNTPVITVINNPDSEINTLVVNQAATFNGTLYVVGEAGFMHKVTFADDIIVGGKIYASEDQAGTAVVDANATSTEIIFNSEYETVPKIVASVVGEDDDIWVNWKIIGKSTKGFRILLQQPMATPISFDWIALPVKGGTAAPVINDLITSLTSVGANIPVELWAQAADPDTSDSELSYSWKLSPNIGKIDGQSGLVYWTIPADQMPSADTDVTVTVTVSDGSHSATKSATIKILVPENNTDVANDQPATTDTSQTTSDQPTETGNNSTTTNQATVANGCTDNTATNYDLTATDDDGSCQYPPQPTNNSDASTTSASTTPSN